METTKVLAKGVAVSNRNESLTGGSRRAERWPALMSRSEAADYLGVSENTLARLKASEELRSVMLRSMVRFRRSDLDRFIDDLPYGDGDCPANDARIAREQARRERQPEARKPEKTRATA